jgi:hypothetical protein
MDLLTCALRAQVSMMTHKLLKENANECPRVSFYRIFMEMCKVNALEIVVFNFLNKKFLQMECLKSATGALVSKTHY